MSLSELQALEAEHVIASYARLPVAFVSGQGCVLRDDEGHEYLDFLAGISVCNAGHCHPEVVAAIGDQAARLQHVSNLFYTEPAMRLAERLTRSGLGGKVFFANSGAEANEAALKLARKARGGGGIVSVDRAFHGRTFGALSATPQESKQAPFAPLVPGFRAVAPDPDALRAAIGDDICAVMLEPVQGEGGIFALSDELLLAAREACDEHGALLVFDEVQCGMGRTGTLWAYEQTPVIPDLLTTAKGLGGGMPIGALLTTPAHADVLVAGDHGTTFGGNPVVSAAANAVMELIDDAAFLAGVRDRGERLLHGLAELPGVVRVQGRGLMVGCDIDADAPDLVRRALFDERLIINATGPRTLRFLPPLIVTDAQIDDALGRLAALLG